MQNQFPMSIFKIRSRESLVLYLAMFIMGACGLAYEYTLSKVASDLLGNSVRQWAVIIGVMMFFMGVGSDVQKYLSNEHLIDKFIALEVLLGLLGAFGPIALLFSYGTISSHYILVQYFFISSIGLIIGLEIPLITRINETYMRELKFNLGAILKMDYIGALAGSVAWIFILTRWFSITQTAFILGLLNITVAGFTLYFFRKLSRFRALLSAFFLASLAITTLGVLVINNWTSHAEQYLYRDQIIFSKTTSYQHIVLTRASSGDIACYINGQLQFNSFDEHIYHENLVHPAFALAPVHRKVLILGGGDGLALREVLKYSDVRRVVLCDIDPEMTRLAAENQILSQLNQGSLKDSRLSLIQNHALVPAGRQMLQVENQNTLRGPSFGPVAEVNVINLDAAKFVEQISGVFDIIIIDFPDPNNPDLSKLYSLPFYQHIRKKLSADGILVQQSTSPVHAREVFLCIGQTMQAAGLTVIPYHDNVPSFGEWGWWIGGRSGRYTRGSLQTKINSLETIPVPTRYLTAELMQSSLLFGRDQLNSESTRINTLTDNIIYKLYLEAWQR